MRLHCSHSHTGKEREKKEWRTGRERKREGNEATHQ